MSDLILTLTLDSRAAAAASQECANDAADVVSLDCVRAEAEVDDDAPLDDHSGQPRALIGRAHYWPQRLLHIPTMYSCEKTGENTYPGVHAHAVREPCYAALSYTWGRFEKPDQPSLPVEGVSWRLPSIDPNHFTTEQLLHVIRKIAELGDVEYIWLDIACINVDTRPFVSVKEVQQQKRIFADGSTTFIWLSKTPGRLLSFSFEKLKSIHREMEELSTSLPEISSVLRRVLSLAQSTFGDVLADPWFSSIWTLQEAFANPDAVILSDDGSPTYIVPDPTVLADHFDRPGSKLKASFGFQKGEAEPSPELGEVVRTPRQLVLWDLVSISRHILVFIAAWHSKVSSEGILQQLFGELHQTIIQSGLATFGTYNLLSVYSSAQYRQEMLSGDRIEYIHKYVFGFPDCCSLLSLPEREALFGKELVLRLPVLSQLFVHTTPPIPGYSWKVAPSSEIPDLEVMFRCFEKYRPAYSTSPGPEMKGMSERVIMLEGSSCDFRIVAETWLHQGDTKISSAKLIGICFDSSILALSNGTLGTVPSKSALPSRTFSKALNAVEWVVPTFVQKTYISNFLNLIGREETRLLLMAYAPGLSEELNLAFGLIVIRQEPQISGTESWKRLGICFWAFQINGVVRGSCSEEALYIDSATPAANSWRKLNGYFA